MSKVRLTHRPTRDPKDEQPSRNEVDTVAAAIALTYELSKSRGFKVGIEIRQNDKVLYDESTLSRAVDRIGTCDSVRSVGALPGRTLLAP